MLGCALIPPMWDAQKQLCYLDQAMNDSVGSIQMKLLPSHIIDSPQVRCSASPFPGSMCKCLAHYQQWPLWPLFLQRQFHHHMLSLPVNPGDSRKSIQSPVLQDERTNLPDFR